MTTDLTYLEFSDPAVNGHRSIELEEIENKSNKKRDPG